MEYQENSEGYDPLERKQHEQEVNITYRRRSNSCCSNRLFRNCNKQRSRHRFIRSRHIFRSIIRRSIISCYRRTQRHTVNERLNINGKGYQGC